MRGILLLLTENSCSPDGTHTGIGYLSQTTSEPSCTTEPTEDIRRTQRGRLSEFQYSGPHGLHSMYSYHAAGAITGKRLRVAGTPLGMNTVSLDAGYTYDGQNKVTAVQYPLSQWSNGTSLRTDHSMARNTTA